VDNSVTFDSSQEYEATFRFPVTWSYLTETPNQTHANPNRPNHSHLNQNQVAPATLPVIVPEKLPVQANVELSSDPAPAGLRGSGPEPKWEMVIPKMARPISSGTASRPAARPPREIEPAPQPSGAPAAPVVETPTEISFYAGSEASFLPRRWKVLSLSIAVVVVGGVIALVRPGAESTVTEAAPAAAGTWSRRTAYVVGSKDPREILVYSGSQDVKNYRIEFSWVPDSLGVGWIFRASDSANYYAAKLRLLQAGATPTLSAEHFAVVKGVESTHSRKVITLGRTDNLVLVRMDANGPAFTVSLQGSPADYWADERFEAGSLGFYADSGERPVLQSIRFTLFKKNGLQTVVTSLQ